MDSVYRPKHKDLWKQISKDQQSGQGPVIVVIKRFAKRKEVNFECTAQRISSTRSN